MPAVDDVVIATHGLSRRFGKRQVVTSVDLRVRRGTVYGLIGPNGAGKSTLFNLLLGLLAPSSGSVELFGQPWSLAVLERIGASVNGPSYYPHLSAEQNLLVHARLLGLSSRQVQPVLERVGMAGLGRRKARKYSTGMRARLALGIALLGDPDMLLLDEPQNGLDPDGIRQTRAMVRAYADAGGTVVISSHLLDEVAHTADHLGVLADGVLRWQGPIEQFAPSSDLETAFFRLTQRSEAP